ncbi:unnamed protein product [Diamesa tonsa]
MDPDIDQNELKAKIEAFTNTMKNSELVPDIQEKSYNISLYCPNNKPDICECTNNQFNCSSNQVEVTAYRDKDVRIHCQSKNELIFNQVTEMSLGYPETLIIENCTLQSEQLLLYFLVQFRKVRVHPPVYFYKNGRNSIYDYIDLSEIALDYMPFFEKIKDMFEHKTFIKLAVQLMLDSDYFKQLLRDIPKAVPIGEIKLKVLKIQGSYLNNLNADAFYCLFIVEDLHFINNKMGTLPNDTFKFAINIKRIIFDGNDFSVLPKTLLSNTSQLTDFELHNNIDSINTIPGSFFCNLKFLKSVLITNSSLKTIPHDVFYGVSNIENISLAMNGLTDVSINIFAQQINLQNIDLSQNNLTSFKHGNLPISLKMLNLSHNQILDIKSDVFKDLSNLEELYLDNNKIDNLQSKIFEDLISIKLIDLRNNTLGSMSSPLQGFIGLHYLETLSLSFNKINVIGNLTQMQSLRELDLSNNNISQVSDIIWKQINSSEMTINLSNNQIKDINQKQLEKMLNQDSITSFIFSNNSFKCSYRLTTLDLRNNQLKTIDKVVIEKLKSIKHLSLMGNNWECTCSLVDLMNYVKSDHKNTIDYNNWICDDNREFKTFKGPSDICFNPIYLILIFTIITTVFGILATLYYRFRKQIKIWLYSHGLCMCLVAYGEENDDKEYDAFIVFSEDDNDYVGRTLIPGLEQQSPHFKCCIPTRDCEAGEMLVTQSLDCIRKSRRTIIVMSKNFLKSQWAQWEFRTSQLTAFKEIENNSRVIVIILGDVEDLEGLHDEFRSYIEINTYVQSNDPWFWKKLRYAMPHRRMLKTNAETEDENYISNNDDIPLI